MTDHAPKFLLRDEAVWFCPADGMPELELGTQGNVLAAMREFLASADGIAAEGSGEVASTMTHRFSGSSGREPQRAEPGMIKVNREGARHELTIVGRIFTSAGAREVMILDLSKNGCRFRERTSHLVSGSGLTIKVGSIGPLAAVVMWARNGEVGAQFHNPLHPSVLEHMTQQFRPR